MVDTAKELVRAKLHQTIWNIAKEKGFYIFPCNLFLGASIAPCIIVLKKSKCDNSILFIYASDEFSHVRNR